MKKIMTLALLVMTSLAVMAQEEVYKAEMDMLDAQGEAIVMRTRRTRFPYLILKRQCMSWATRD